MSHNEALFVRCEPDSGSRFHTDALAESFPGAREIQLPAGERLPDLSTVSRVVISGSTAGVYETGDYPWIARGRELVHRLVEDGVPTLGVCFGHQLVNDALGGRVDHEGMRAGLVEALFTEDPLFDGVSPVVPVLHGDVVHEAGDGMRPIAGVADYEYPLFATRHEAAPVWTVQFHPELDRRHRDRLQSAFDWQDNGYDFVDVTGERLFENFRRLSADS